MTDTLYAMTTLTFSGEWIPLADRLPDPGETVMVATSRGAVFPLCSVSPGHLGCPFFAYDDSLECPDIIDGAEWWAPLPDAPVLDTLQP